MKLQILDMKLQAEDAWAYRPTKTRLIVRIDRWSTRRRRTRMS
jgi:hypothetical protein